MIRAILNSFGQRFDPFRRPEGCPAPVQVKALQLPPPCLSTCSGKVTRPGRGASMQSHSRPATPGRSFSLTEARQALRRVHTSDEDMLAACALLRARGDCDDEWIVWQIEQAIEQSQSMIEVPTC